MKRRRLLSSLRSQHRVGHNNLNEAVRLYIRKYKKMFGYIVHLLGPVWSARLIRFITFFIRIIADLYAFGRSIGQSTAHWLGGSSNIWVFLRENVGPLPSSAVSNYRTNSNVTWEFNISNTTLHYTDPHHDSETDEDTTIEVRNLPWLSAKIVYDGRGEYDIDDFCTNFQIIAPTNVNPTPKLILSCWSIWSKEWLLPGQSARFVIINGDGEEESFSIHLRPGIEVDRWGVLFDVEESDEDEVSECEEGASECEEEASTYEESECEEGEGNNDADNEAEEHEEEGEADAVSEHEEGEKGEAVETVEACTTLDENVQCEEITL